MKQKMRGRLHTCGQVLGFLSRYGTLYKGEPLQSAEIVFTDYCKERK